MTSQPTERLIFSVTGEGLLRGIQSQMTAPLKERLARAGLDSNKTLPPAWPAARLVEWLDIVAAELFPHLTRDAAHRRIGLLFTQGWQNTLIGSAASALFRVVGPQRTLARIGRAFRTGDNFTETTCEFPSARVAQLTLRTTRLPHFIAGQFDGGLGVLKLDGVVNIVTDSDEAMVFTVEWKG